MRRWWLIILSIIVMFVTLEVTGKSTFNATAFGTNKSNKPRLIVQNSSSIRIMPLGDSITGGEGGQNSYRRLLWFYLLNGGYNVDFVGSLRVNCGRTPPQPDFDLDNEGHCGWRADQILAQIDQWASSTRPNIVLIHLGTNDLGSGESPESTIEDIRGIIQKLRYYNPYVKILLAQIITTCGSEERKISFNSLIPNLANQTSTYQSPVIVVDQYNGFNVSDTIDGCHPNNTGEGKLASRWFEALKKVF
ncbi:SGNH/GDSL hydrolase family protein [Pelatocladus sp. BLCC-F211]|uniref:SGNH/GDSL hydrolase family protein n=1 Tax=Pelatocladus sp. BLCC-F211 TaxID=3342752 RepID=UPI0035B978F2